MDYLAAPLYALLFLGFFAALKKSHPIPVIATSLLGFVGVIIFLALPSSFSWAMLNGNLTPASIDAQKMLFQAANGAVTASDLWQGTGSFLGRILIQTSLFLISLIMLQSNVFGRGTAWAGIATHGLGLLHILVGYFLPAAGFAWTLIAGLLSLVWLLFLVRDFFRLGNESAINSGSLELRSMS